MSTKVRIKIGSVEIDFEGSEEFLKSELMKLVSSLSELSKESGMDTPPDEPGLPGQEDGITIQWSTDTIASKLACKTGPDLVLAACAHLKFAIGKTSFKRLEILEDMQTATGHYKDSFASNLTYYLKGLIKKDKLNELTAKDTYALNQKAIKELRQILDIK